MVVDVTGPDCEGSVVRELSLEQGWNTLQRTLTNVADPTPTVTLAVIAQPDGFDVYVDEKRIARSTDERIAPRHRARGAISLVGAGRIELPTSTVSM